MQIIVSGGTNAGWRRLKAAAKDWKCPECGANLKHYWLRCPNDGHLRPDEGS